MKRSLSALPIALAIGLFGVCSVFAQGSGIGEPDWSVNMTVMETCSCPVFCQCFFTGKPPADCSMNAMGGMKNMSFCRFNQAYKVNSGHFGSLRLDGAKFWFAGDAGDDFAHAKLPWIVMMFDTYLSVEQRSALTTILHHIHFYRPERWTSYKIGKSAAMDWAFTKDSARATLDGGKTAEVVLRRLDGGMNDQPVTMNNMDYFGYPRNSGFLLMPNEVEAYRIGDKAFAYHGTNGLVTTVEISSKDIRK
jgi:hypothetical protein